ncbi:MAG: ATP-binding cassette domain-containing protein [Spirochaetes bacterium]|nr:ATP-binding cassette domain-containing protein [Spirochaetota bacterium]
MEPLLEFNSVACSAPGYEPLEGVSFSLASGENALLFGIERSGLKTITPLLLGIEERFEGDIRFGGLTIRGLDYLGRLTFKDRIGYLHGDYGLISNMTVEQNISLRLEYYSEYSPREISEITERIMRDLCIVDLRNARPVELTNSQILRTAYGRAVAHDPDLLIIEHALVGQSMPDIRTFMDVLKRRASSPHRSVVFVTYEPNKFLDFVDSLYMLYNGMIVFSGTRKDYLESDNPFVAQYRSASLEGPMEIR